MHGNLNTRVLSIQKITKIARMAVAYAMGGWQEKRILREINI